MLTSMTKDKIKSNSSLKSSPKGRKNTGGGVPYVETFANERLIHIRSLKNPLQNKQIDVQRNIGKLKSTSTRKVVSKHHETKRLQQKSTKNVNKTEVGIQANISHDEKLNVIKKEILNINRQSLFKDSSKDLFKATEDVNKIEFNKSLDELVKSAVNYVDIHLHTSTQKTGTKKNPYAVFDVVKPPPLTEALPATFSEKTTKPLDSTAFNDNNPLGNSPRNKTIKGNFMESNANDLRLTSNAQQLIKDLEKDLQNLQDEAVEIVKKSERNAKNLPFSATINKNTLDSKSYDPNDDPIEVFFPKLEKISKDQKHNEKKADDLEDFHKLLHEIQDRCRTLNDNLEENVHKHNSEELKRIFDLVKINPSSFKEKMYIKQKVDEYISSMKPQIMTEVKHYLKEIQQKPKNARPVNNLVIEDRSSEKVARVDVKKTMPAKTTVAKYQMKENTVKKSSLVKSNHSNPNAAISRTSIHSEKKKSPVKKNSLMMNKSKSYHKFDTSSQVKPLSSPAKQIREPRPYFHLQNSISQTVVAWPPVKKSVCFQNEDSHIKKSCTSASLSLHAKKFKNTSHTLNHHNTNLPDYQDKLILEENNAVKQLNKRKNLKETVSTISDNLIEKLRTDITEHNTRSVSELLENGEMFYVEYEKEEILPLNLKDSKKNKNNHYIENLETNTNEKSMSSDLQRKQTINNSDSSCNKAATQATSEFEELTLQEIKDQENLSKYIIIEHEDVPNDLLNHSEKEINLSPSEKVNVQEESEGYMDSKEPLNEQNILTKGKKDRNNVFDDDCENDVDILAAGDIARDVLYKDASKNVNSKGDSVLITDVIETDKISGILKKPKNVSFSGTTTIDNIKNCNTEDVQIQNGTSSCLLLKVNLSPTVHDTKHQWKIKRSNSGMSYLNKNRDKFQSRHQFAILTENFEKIEEKDESSPIESAFFENQPSSRAINPDEKDLREIAFTENNKIEETIDTNEVYLNQNVKLQTEELSFDTVEKPDISEEFSIITEEITEHDKNFSKAVELYEKMVMEVNNVQTRTAIGKDNSFNEFNSTEFAAGFEITGVGGNNSYLTNKESSTIIINNDNHNEEASLIIDEDQREKTEDQEELDELLTLNNRVIFTGFPSMEKEIKKLPNHAILKFFHARKKPPPSSQILPASETSSQKLLRIAQNWIGQELLARSLSLIVPPSSSSAHFQTGNSQYKASLCGGVNHKTFIGDVDENTLKSILLEVLNEEALNIIRDKNNFKLGKQEVTDKANESFISESSSSEIQENEEKRKLESPDYEDDYLSSRVNTPLPTPIPSPDISEQDKNEDKKVKKLVTPTPSLNSSSSDDKEKSHGSKELASPGITNIAHTEFVKPATPVCTPSPRKDQKELLPYADLKPVTVRSLSPSTSEEKLPTNYVHLIEQATQVSLADPANLDCGSTSHRETVIGNTEDDVKDKEMQTNKQTEMMDAATSPVVLNLTESSPDSFTMASMSTTLSEGEWRPRNLNKFNAFPNVHRKSLDRVDHRGRDVQLDNTLLDIDDLEQDLHSEGEIYFHRSVERTKLNKLQANSEIKNQENIILRNPKVVESLMKRDEACSPGEIKPGFLAFPSNNQMAASPRENSTNGLATNASQIENSNSFTAEEEKENPSFNKINNAENDFQTLRTILASLSENSLSERQKTFSQMFHPNHSSDKLPKATRLKTVAFKEPLSSGSSSQWDGNDKIETAAQNANKDEVSSPSEKSLKHDNTQSCLSTDNLDTPSEMTFLSQSPPDNSYSEGEIIL